MKFQHFFYTASVCIMLQSFQPVNYLINVSWIEQKWMNCAKHKKLTNRAKNSQIDTFFIN